MNDNESDKAEDTTYTVSGVPVDVRVSNIDEFAFQPAGTMSPKQLFGGMSIDDFYAMDSVKEHYRRRDLEAFSIGSSFTSDELDNMLSQNMNEPDIQGNIPSNILGIPVVMKDFIELPQTPIIFGNSEVETIRLTITKNKDGKFIADFSENSVEDVAVLMEMLSQLPEGDDEEHE